MSKQEFGRLEVLLRVQSGRLRVADACELIGLHRRQVFRLLRGLKQDGAASLLSKRRGKPSNNRLPEAYRDLALSLVRAHHYTEANCPAQAITYWQKAGTAAGSKSANLEAIDQFHRGLALVEALPDPRERAERSWICKWRSAPR